jgi:hypothetical protein
MGTTVSSATATTTSGAVLAPNVRRLSASIRNAGAATVYLATRAVATVNDTAVDPPNYFDLPTGYLGVVSAITASGTATLEVTESADAGQPLVYTGTWANRPVTATANDRALITDVGTYVQFVGGRWQTLARQVIGVGAGAVTDATTTNLITQASTTIPAKLLGPIGSARLVAEWDMAGTTGVVTASLSFGGNVVAQSAAIAVNTSKRCYLAAVIMNQGSESSQRYSEETPGLLSSVLPTLSVDTTQDVLCEATVQWAVAVGAGDTITNRRWRLYVEAQ